VLCSERLGYLPLRAPISDGIGRHHAFTAAGHNGPPHAVKRMFRQQLQHTYILSGAR
jgi:hypothetical protein